MPMTRNDRPPETPMSGTGGKRSSIVSSGFACRSNFEAVARLAREDVLDDEAQPLDDSRGSLGVGLQHHDVSGAHLPGHRDELPDMSLGDLRSIPEEAASRIYVSTFEGRSRD